MSVNLVWSARAAEDLSQIELYGLEVFGVAATDAYIAQFDAAAARLSEFPGLLQRKTEISQSLQFYRVSRHFLVCLPISDTIYIASVIHGAADLPARLGELESQLKAEVARLHSEIAKRL